MLLFVLIDLVAVSLQVHSCTDLACHASLQVMPDLIACLSWIPCLRARISVPARVPAEWSSPPPMLFRYQELFRCIVLFGCLHGATVAGVVSPCRCNPLVPNIACNKELICSMLSSAVFQKTSPRSLDWNTGRSGFSEPGCHTLCQIYNFGLNTLPSKTFAIPTCGLSTCFSISVFA